MRVLAVVGPTAVGKTALGIALAEALGGEVVSADSRQVYRYMDIGTAKPTPEQRMRVPHHMIDVVLPDQYFSAGEYARLAAEAIQDVARRGKLPVVVGGSGLYISALFDGLFEEGARDPALRWALRERARMGGSEALHRELREVDPEAAARIHPHDLQRIVRALEVYRTTGRPLSSWQRERRPRLRAQVTWVGLDMDRGELYRKIDARVEEMMDRGLIEEVRALLEMGYSPELPALRTVGYKEVFPYLEGRRDLEGTIAQIRRNTRSYARRQLTWFRRDPRIRWLDAGAGEEALIRTISAILG
ncbi:MAG TPA: tRNA (adenosine(37)-N6)-dimethylallyltransferase MiaA [Candidatus Latescibacteria bacterium]|nr:tRNA (adenosine(37)-N6)-dimethylallyltransferase MiaA [Candidatus Latescibacterota bacterium]